MLVALKNFIRRVLSRIGYEIIPARRVPLPPQLEEIGTDLTRYKVITERIPGMVSIDAAEMLYALCLTQTIAGNVLEIGSWQGRSTSYLARAVRDSGNGHMFAVDHFQGNKGRESLYAVEGRVDNLQANFERNIRELGLDSVVTVLPYSSEMAFSKIADKAIRFLFIDGDHTEAGVRADIELFCPMVTRGGIVVFDDFDQSFPGVISATQKWIKSVSPRNVFVRNNTLVCQV